METHMNCDAKVIDWGRLCVMQMGKYGVYNTSRTQKKTTSDMRKTAERLDTFTCLAISMPAKPYSLVKAMQPVQVCIWQLHCPWWKSLMVEISVQCYVIWYRV